MTGSPTVQTGLDRLANGENKTLLEGRKIGLIANPTSVDKNLRHAVDILHQKYGLKRLFGPEHGIRGDAQDMISVEETVDPSTGCEVVSLYGDSYDSLSPLKSDLEDLDVLIFDIQDVGARYYTYVWTMVLAMRVCEKVGIEMLILDRPNPLGGRFIEGSNVKKGFESFVGLCDIPNQHGLTVGEIARWRHRIEKMTFPLTVLEMRGWKRDMVFQDTGLSWVMPSPNMPTLDTALVYPGMCLVEGTELSEARGTTKPFELFGAPYMDGAKLANALDKMTLQGVRFRPCSFLPQFQKQAQKVCGGIQIHVTDRQHFRSYRTGLALLYCASKLWPDDFKFREKAYEFVDDIPAIDLLYGSTLFRDVLNHAGAYEDIVADVEKSEASFAASLKEWHLYQ